MLRVNGARVAEAAAVLGRAAEKHRTDLVGIAEPEAQAGARNVTTSNAKLRGVDGARVLLDAAPARGFVGGAALDGQGQLAGMIDLAPAVTAGPATASRSGSARADRLDPQIPRRRRCVSGDRQERRRRREGCDRAGDLREEVDADLVMRGA